MLSVARTARFRSIAIQVVFGLALLIALNFLVVRALDVGISYDFMGQRANFNAEGVTLRDFGSPFDLSEFSASNSYRDAYVLGVLNTVRVALLGIVLATVVGIVAGVARLSRNWLVSRLATAYVELFRNTPLIVQLVFWYTAVFLKLPSIGDSASLFDVVFLSNRGLALPGLEGGGNSGLFVGLAGLGLIAGLAVRWYRARLQDETGTPRYPSWSGLAVIVGVAALAFVVTGLPLTVETPDLAVRSYEGGIVLSPEFAALLIALVAYTGAFIAEIVRGSILAIPKGQTEASAALGLTYFQRLNLIILPQAMRIMVPPLTNQYLNLTKNSSLAVAIAFPDIVSVSNTIINQTGSAVSMVVLIMGTYLVLSLLISLLMNTLNARLRTGEAG